MKVVCVQKLNDLLSFQVTLIALGKPLATVKSTNNDQVKQQKSLALIVRMGVGSGETIQFRF